MNQIAKLKTDSPISRNIVISFLDFLNSVEPAPGIDLEGLEVVRECLQEVFRLNQPSYGDRLQPGLLVEYFSSLVANKQQESKPNPSQPKSPVDAPSSSTSSFSEASKAKGEDAVGDSHVSGISRDELLTHFLGALDRICFFNTTRDDADAGYDPVDNTVRVFYEAVEEMEKSGIQLNLTNLADTFKSKGNKAMQSKSYAEAIFLYTFAITLCGNNAVYYCNRAAAYTQIHKHTEAIRDCLKSIEIDPNYSKAYSRLGLAYYAQGNYRDAINKGFSKALQLDPSSESVKENIRMSEQKLREEMQRTEQNQNSGWFSGSYSNQQQNAQSDVGGGLGNENNPPPPTFTTSIPFNAANLPADFANMFMNFASNAYQGQQNAQESNAGTQGSHDEQQHHQQQHQQQHHQQHPQPEIRMDGNIRMNVNGEDVSPDDLMGTWRSVMGMFTSGNVSQSHPPPDQQQHQQRGPQQ